MTALDAGCLVLDTETTAPDPNEARLVQACFGVSKVAGGKGYWNATTVLANPGIPIPEGAASVHGITDEMVAGAEPEIVVAVDLAHAMHDAWSKGWPVVIFNAPYDLTVIDRALRRGNVGGLTIDGPVIDPYIIDKTCDKYRRGSRKLVDMAKHYGIPLAMEDAHGAEADSLATVRTTWAMLDRLTRPRSGLDVEPLHGNEPDGVWSLLLRELNARQLHMLQTEWYATWMTEFAEYRRGKGDPLEDESTDWPIRPWRGEVGA